MKKFTDICQFRNVVKAVKTHHDFKGLDENEEPIYRHDSAYPTIQFRGTVKLHGTNSAIVLYKDGRKEYQSRERVLTLQEDNSGFMLAMSNINTDLLFKDIQFQDYCAIYGELCGGNIQKGIAISKLPKMWVIFAVKIDDVYQDTKNFTHLKMEDKRIFNILQFEHYFMDIDFEKPEEAQNKLVEYTNAVEKQCPVGKYFNAEGCGEGICWEAILSPTDRYIFKVKGKEHSSSKVKTLATVDVEAVNTIREFVEYACTNNRLQQGIDKMIEMKIPLEDKSTGNYIRWIFNDIVKEENDTIIKNQIDVKKIGSFINAKARVYWMKHLDSLI